MPQAKACEDSFIDTQEHSTTVLHKQKHTNIRCISAHCWMVRTDGDGLRVKPTQIEYRISCFFFMILMVMDKQITWQFLFYNIYIVCFYFVCQQDSFSIKLKALFHWLKWFKTGRQHLLKCALNVNFIKNRLYRSAIKFFT